MISSKTECDSPRPCHLSCPSSPVSYVIAKGTTESATSKCWERHFLSWAEQQSKQVYKVQTQFLQSCTFDQGSFLLFFSLLFLFLFPQTEIASKTNVHPCPTSSIERLLTWLNSEQDKENEVKISAATFWYDTVCSLFLVYVAFVQFPHILVRITHWDKDLLKVFSSFSFRQGQFNSSVMATCNQKAFFGHLTPTVHNKETCSGCWFLIHTVFMSMIFCRPLPPSCQTSVQPA